MAAAAPLLATPWAAPAIGAAAGAIFNKKNPLQGALLGGVGGAALGPAMGGIGGLNAAGAAGANPLNAMAYGASMPAMGGEQAAMLAGQTGAFGAPGLAATSQAAGGGGLLSAMQNPMVKAGMKMAMPQQQQPQPMMAAPMQQPAQPMQGSMTRFGMGQPMINGGRY